MHVYGIREPKLRFNNDGEFYKALGLIAKSIEVGGCSIAIEQNQEQGAWAEEYRIRIYSNPNKIFEQIFTGKVTKGTGNLVGRINNNEYIKKIIVDHAIPLGVGVINVGSIMATVPKQHVQDFNSGYQMI